MIALEKNKLPSTDIKICCFLFYCEKKCRRLAMTKPTLLLSINISCCPLFLNYETNLLNKVILTKLTSIFVPGGGHIDQCVF